MFDLQRFADAPIPQELAGVSEDVARTIMAKAAQPQPSQNPSDDPVDAGDPENVKVSYSRFKETLDQKNEFERELAAYRERSGSLNAQPQPPQNPPQESYRQAPSQTQQQAAQQQEFQRRAYMQNQSTSAFNDYVARQQAADNFAAVQQFAANDFFNQQSDLYKNKLTRVVHCAKVTAEDIHNAR